MPKGIVSKADFRKRMVALQARKLQELFQDIHALQGIYREFSLAEDTEEERLCEDAADCKL